MTTTWDEIKKRKEQKRRWSERREKKCNLLTNAIFSLLSLIFLDVCCPSRFDPVVNGVHVFSSLCLVLNSKEFTEDIDSIWDFSQSIQQYTSTGGTSKQSVIQQIQSLRNWMQEKTLLWSILTPERKERRVTSTVTLVQTTTWKYRKTRSTSITRVSESRWKMRLVSFSLFRCFCREWSLLYFSFTNKMT